MSEPKVILDAISGIFPDFKPYWESEGNIYRGDDGSFTFHGLFAVVSHYVRERYSEIGEEQREELFRFVESCIPEVEDSEGLGNAVHTCFIENMVGDIPSNELGKYMKPKTRKIFNYYDETQPDKGMRPTAESGVVIVGLDGFEGRIRRG